MARPRFAKLAPAHQQAILGAALTEFAALGIREASLNRIIDAAGISKDSMYYYFDNKEDLFAYATRVEFEHPFAELGPASMDEAAQLITTRGVFPAQHVGWVGFEPTT